MASKVVQAFYNDDDILLLAVKKVKEAISHRRGIHSFSCSWIG